MSKDLARLFANPFLSAYDRVSGVIAPLAAAFLLLLIGMFTARAARALVEAAMSKARIDEFTSRAGLNELLARLGLGKSPSAVAAFIVHWFLLVVFIVSAANVLNMTAVTELLERFVMFLPSMVASVLILFGGLLFARLVSQVLLNAASANSVRGGNAVAAAAWVAVLVASAAAALEQLGVRPSLLVSAVQILLGSVGLALAIACGLGAKDVAADFIKDLVARRR
ncbi:MAG: hypothetical protein A2506_10305 [Elusimicrobia bacterium RIFOXYD12_FULL_66_9]|nr:MAG: hypothetical protein A2506_10305 [Elusimicrobia bacterium RIFOXYD12_FULL_66_9]